LASTLIEEQALCDPPLIRKTVWDKEKMKVAIEEEAEIVEKKRPTLASTLIEEQALYEPSLTHKTILDKEKTKVAIDKEAEIERKKRPTLLSTLIEDQALDEAPQARLVTHDLASNNQKKPGQGPPMVERNQASVSN
jgi:demethoxyubiquinone hydroxylase (CLK1/Coq7/Cat5 family)